MKTLKIFGAVAALTALAGIAHADDYIVVRSNEASIAKGSPLAAGSRVALPAGKALTLVSPGGEVVSLQGSAGGAVVPGVSKPGDSAAGSALTALVNRPPPRRSFGAMRGNCPGAEALQTLEQILAASKLEGCGSVAQAALEAYVDRAGAAPPAGAAQKP
ncbi:MAG: hypothetical protein ACKO9D_07495 [Gammaproteobacteria bacterium]